MKNSAIVCFVLLVLAGCVKAQPTSLNIYGLTGKVKNVEEKTVGYSNAKGKDKKSFESATFTMYFDRDGRLTSRTLTSLDRTTDEVYEYLANGIRKSVSQTHRALAGPNERSIPSIYASVFKYDAEKNCLSEDTYSAFRQTGPDYVIDKPGQRYQYIFDDTGRLSKKVELDEKGRVVTTTEYYYRSDGPPTQEVETAGGRVIAMSRITYEFDGNKNWTKRTKISDLTPQLDPDFKSITTRKIDYFK